LRKTEEKFGLRVNAEKGVSLILQFLSREIIRRFTPCYLEH